MGKATIASKLAKTFDTTYAKASRFLDDVGPRAAKQFGRAGRSGSLAKWGAGAAGATALGGGALYWRQQDVDEAQAAAEQAESSEEVVRNIIESDLDGKLKKDLVDDALAATGGGNQGGGGFLGGLKDAIPSLPDADPMMWIILIVVVLWALNNAVDGGR